MTGFELLMLELLILGLIFGIPPILIGKYYHKLVDVNQEGWTDE